VAPQYDIWPQGKTYPKNEIAIAIIIISTPLLQVLNKLKEKKYIFRAMCMYINRKNIDDPLICK